MTDLHKLNLMFRSRYRDIYNKVKEDSAGVIGFKKRVSEVWYSYLKKHGVLRVSSHNRLPKRVGVGCSSGEVYYYVPDPHADLPLNGFRVREDLAERILFLGWP